MKRVKLLIAALMIFLINLSCFAWGGTSFFDPVDWDGVGISTWGIPQKCNTLRFNLNFAPTLVYVTVDDIDFTCGDRTSSTPGRICSGPSSSLDPNLTVKIFAGKGNQEPKKVITIPNPRPWDRCDYDGDGAMDAEDSCPADPEIWICACEVGDGDMDGDTVPDCIDQCPEDMEKTGPGRCGCNVSDGDTDQDGMPDCLDECPEDPTKEAPEYCGCGVAETDTDGDFTPDCVDNCPDNPQKTEPGICGCGLSDLDEDGDGLIPCQDPCPGDAWHDDIGEPCDHDEDNDGTTDDADGCPYDSKKINPGSCGCGVPDPC